MFLYPFMSELMVEGEECKTSAAWLMVNLRQRSSFNTMSIFVFPTLVSSALFWPCFEFSSFECSAISSSSVSCFSTTSILYTSLISTLSYPDSSSIIAPSLLISIAASTAIFKSLSIFWILLLAYSHLLSTSSYTTLIP